MTKREWLWPAVLIAWLVASVVLLADSARDMRSLRLPDPDDTMRLMEVRDWLAGQSWWDVRQYHFVAGDMHWSRLVDLPIAAVMLATAPMFGVAGAERIALIVVPLATFLVVLALAAGLTRRVLDTERARAAVLIAPLSIPLLYQLRPMRIDHHGWQVALALAALFLLLGRPSFRNGAWMGICLSGLITVSLEGLPISAALCGIAALAWAFDPARRNMLLGMAWSLFATLALLQLATRGIHYAAPMCDAVTLDWVAVAGMAAFTVSLATLAARAPLALRLGALGLAGCATLGVLLATAPECLGGPFAQLDPLTRALWYEKVSEGLPIWHQSPAVAIKMIGLPIVGLIGSILALRRSDDEVRTRWTLLVAAQLLAFLFALLVMRAGATANAFAVPGAAWALHAMLTRARAIRPVIIRTFATAAALFIASPGLVAMALLDVPRALSVQAQRPGPALAWSGCVDGTESRAVAQLPPALLFAPLDIAPDIVATTHHRAITSGYHRNSAAMHDVISAFIGTPEAAHALIRRFRADYVVICPGMNEPVMYRAQNLAGFAARLLRGERFDWLQPVPIAGSPVLVWRVRN
ncbi:hypothetical protein MZO42_09660 [Sphingomonas psychrotolerans]|uniref:AcrB/AcrD/AcrF family protein n=1 Tax=Sphingomonas psychrotolerans TaxID=1327635 RepID=A0ABU3N3A3_9SPHN|nr:hypothetical protein [Sphingomonas psychrotolerans]MDT8758962.1 hypothetical protein [Sphingomonas psychrotolerans]